MHKFRLAPLVQRSRATVHTHRWTFRIDGPPIVLHCVPPMCEIHAPKLRLTEQIVVFAQIAVFNKIIFFFPNFNFLTQIKEFRWPKIPKTKFLSYPFVFSFFFKLQKFSPFLLLSKFFFFVYSLLFLSFKVLLLLLL